MYSISRIDLVPSYIVPPRVFLLICHAIKKYLEKKKNQAISPEVST